MFKKLILLLAISILFIRVNAQDEAVDAGETNETTVAAIAEGEENNEPTVANEQNAEEEPKDGGDGGGGAEASSVAPPEQTENDATTPRTAEDAEQPAGGSPSESEPAVNSPDDKEKEPEVTEKNEKEPETNEKSEQDSDKNEKPVDSTPVPDENSQKNETSSEKTESSSAKPSEDDKSVSSSTESTSESSNENTTMAEFYPYFHISSPQSTEPEYQPVGTLIESSSEMPWRAYFRFNNSNSKIYCGGAILTRYKIITTASCLFDNKTKELYPAAVVMAGGIQINAFSYKERIDLETQAIVYPRFNVSDPYLNHNLAIITLIQPLSFSSSVNNIEISAVPTDDSAKLYLSGFGRSSNGDPYVDAKRHRVKLVNIAVCRSTFGPNACTANVLATVGEFTKLASICRVESGAPLTYHPGWFRKPLLIGLASFVSDEGCLTGNPDGHVYLARYLSWIREILLL